MISKLVLIWTIVFASWDFLFVDVFGLTKNIAFLCYFLILPILGLRLINPLRKVWSNPDRLKDWIDSYIDGTQIPAFIVYCFFGTLISLAFNWLPFFCHINDADVSGLFNGCYFFYCDPSLAQIKQSIFKKSKRRDCNWNSKLV